MRGSLFRLREPFCWPVAIGGLPENPQISVAIGLERDPLTIGGPDRKVIPAIKCEPTHRACAGQVVDPHVGFSTIVGSERDAFPVRRNARVFVRTQWNLQRLHAAFPIDQSQLILGWRRRDRTGNVNQCSGVGKTEVRGTGRCVVRAADALKDWYRSAGDSQPPHIERDCEQRPTHRIHYVTGGHIPPIAPSFDEGLAFT